MGGITTWALALAGQLASRGGRVTLLANQRAARSFSGAAPVGRIDPSQSPQGVRVVPIDCDSDAGPSSGCLPAWHAAIDELAATAPGVPVCISPNLTIGSYALATELVRSRPSEVRAIGWMHSQTEFDRRLLRHSEGAISLFAPVSHRCHAMLEEAMPDRAADLRLMPYGVPVPGTIAARSPLAGRPLRLITTGRIEHEQKRSGALLAMSRLLHARGIAHELLFVGEGPMAADIDAVRTTMPWVSRIGPTSWDGASLTPADVAAHLDRADIFVLASKYEGLSVAMLEAMARGCACVVSNVSGASDAIDHGFSGWIVDCPPGHDDDAIGAAMASGVERALAAGIPALGRAAWRTARQRYTIEAMGLRACALLEHAAASPPRELAAAPPSPGFSVPPDAVERARAALARLSGRPVALWGAGRHTQHIASELAAAPANIVALIDDDAARLGESIAGLRIVRPPDLCSLGVRDVLISSAMHEAALWARRSELEQLGLRVHRMYAA